MFDQAYHNKGLILGDKTNPAYNPEESMKCFDKAIEINGKDADSYYNKAIL